MTCSASSAYRTLAVRTTANTLIEMKKLDPKLRRRWKSEDASGNIRVGRVANATMERGTHISPVPTPWRTPFQATDHGSTSRLNRAMFHPLHPIRASPMIMPARGSNRPMRPARKNPRIIPAPRAARRSPIMASG